MSAEEDTDAIKKTVVKRCMKFIPIHTRPLLPPQDNLYEVLAESLPSLREGDILCITSKVLAIHQGRCIPAPTPGEKDRIVLREADRFIPGKTRNGNLFLTIKGMEKKTALVTNAIKNASHITSPPSCFKTLYLVTHLKTTILKDVLRDVTSIFQSS